MKSLWGIDQNAMRTEVIQARNVAMIKLLD
jgi:hypothetical protein